MTWWTFTLLVWVSLLVPGPDFVVITQAALAGTGRGVRTAAGVVAGLCLHGIAAAAGLSAVLLSLPGVAGPLRVVGGGVLVWFGVSMLRTASPADPGGDGGPRGGGGRWFLRGLAVNALNPKALLFFAAVVPQFVDTSAPVLPQAALLGATVVVSGALWWALVVTLVRAVRLPADGRVERVATRGGGAVLIALGALLAARSL
ncbi:Threonine/homoserine/homoserine lactone efflux protein [Nocardiopsis flavescens]|uniref:Threonine/homoserine/homoserine lactone efflux protein n=1 Tax=Nocardiopsis flavescens TaxID=758803 RepID=A0A1M6JIN6_9ACTN|nr:LysE family translocator [Nocardiopsis flavescens]SHJ46482.1 Threonine/homoserine/homoserine lactone efflux protein [Nocardiopsis flavescens]